MRLIALLLLPLFASGQCETDRTGRAYMAIPSFFSLYFNGQCIERFMSDTTICVKYPPNSVGQVAGFSYSSPSGQPAFVTSVKQYNEACELIAVSPQIYPSTDTITVCYNIQAALIDNFCPYAILMPGLAVEFCQLSNKYEQNFLTVDWATCSNSGTALFYVMVSDDLVKWDVMANVYPHYTNWSDILYYTAQFYFTKPGMHYVKVVELDYNGVETSSEALPFNVPYTVLNHPQFDIIGRKIHDASYKYYVPAQR